MSRPVSRLNAFYDLFYACHVSLRLLACSALLVLTVTTHHFAAGLAVMLTAGLLIHALDGHSQQLKHVLRLLRWFVLPILLLHLFFSHGQLIFPGSVLPFTWQGLQQGLWLSLHLAAIYLAAMLMFRALTVSEWNRSMLSIPWFGKRLSLYMMMMRPMRQQTGQVLQQLKLQWQLRRDWLKFPLLMLTSFHLAMHGAVDQARMLWLRWPEGGGASDEQYGVTAVGDVRRFAMNTGCLIFAVAIYGMILL